MQYCVEIVDQTEIRTATLSKTIYFQSEFFSRIVVFFVDGLKVELCDFSTKPILIIIVIVIIISYYRASQPASQQNTIIH